MPAVLRMPMVTEHHEGGIQRYCVGNLLDEVIHEAESDTVLWIRDTAKVRDRVRKGQMIDDQALGAFVEQPQGLPCLIQLRRGFGTSLSFPGKVPVELVSSELTEGTSIRKYRDLVAPFLELVEQGGHMPGRHHEIPDK